ncbi:hypothetical protein Tco_1458773 [Tanacetum coccineum]
MSGALVDMYICKMSNVYSDEIKEKNQVQSYQLIQDTEATVLDRVPLGGSAYNLGPQSASKMSKLDRFLILGKMLLGMIQMLMRKIGWNSLGTFRNRFDKLPASEMLYLIAFKNSFRLISRKTLECKVSKKRFWYQMEKMDSIRLNRPKAHYCQWESLGGIPILQGRKVGENMSRVHAWKEVIVKIKSRLSNWKLKTLSIGGRFTLLNCHFFHGHDPRSKKASWVNWTRFSSKKEGSWAFQSLLRLNRGNGEILDFGKTNWIMSGVLKDVIPRLYRVGEASEDNYLPETD